MDIKAVIKHLKPDLLLVESRPAELAKGNLADGPVEMLFSNLTSRSLGIKVDGMDWWQKGSIGSNDLRENKMFQNTLVRLKNNKKVLILTGFSHVPEFAKRFKEKGFKEIYFGDDEKTRLFKTTDKKLVFPVKMAYYLKKRIAIEKAEFKNEKDDRNKDIIKQSIELRLDILKIIEGSE